MPQLIESIGGSSRMITLLTLVIHFIHPLLCIANYLDWVRHQSGDDSLGERIVIAYLAMSIIAALFYLLVSSVFYMWAWRYPEPEEIAKRRRIYGVFTNLFFSDLPIFLVEVSIVWIVGAATPLQITSFVFTCISMLYSGLRVWTFIMVKVIKIRAPQPGPAVAGARTYDGPPTTGRGFASPDGAGGVVPGPMYSPGGRY